MNWTHHSVQVLDSYIKLFDAVHDQYMETAATIAKKLTTKYEYSPDMKLFTDFMGDRYNIMYQTIQEAAMNKSSQERKPDATGELARRATLLDTIEDKLSGLTVAGHIVRDANDGAQFHPIKTYPLSGFGMELDGDSDGSQQDGPTST